MSSSEDDEKPLIMGLQGKLLQQNGNAKGLSINTSLKDDEDEDESMEESSSSKTKTKGKALTKKRSTPAKSSSSSDVDLSEEEDESSFEEEKKKSSKEKVKKQSSTTKASPPAAKKVKTATGSATASKPSTPAKSNGAASSTKSDAKKPKVKVEKKGDTPVKKEVKKPVAKKKGKDGEEAEEGAEGEEQEYKWWLEGEKEGGVKWETLEHAGPLFPPVYVPHGVKMKYDGQPVELAPAAEEVASFFAALLGSDHAANETFCKNFFSDLLGVIKDSKKPCAIKEFSECDFTPIFDYLNTQKDLKKQATKEDKLKVKEEKAEIDEKYGWAILDGHKEKVGNFRIEPPGLFRGRGEHPKTGCLKTRVRPEQVTINIGEKAKIPVPPPGTKWGSVQHDNTVTWLATWKENVNENTKYIFLAATSSLKGQSDFKKFEKARELKKHIESIRKNYTKDLKAELMSARQLATCLYLIDKLALRAGNEKGDDEADTVGCCSLRYEHLTLEPPNKVVFDFLGKDSIRYVNTVAVEPQVFKNLKIFKRDPKTEGDSIFDRIDTSMVNKHLSAQMPGLTAKVFRTYNASFTFQEELKKTPEDGTVAEKVLAYNRANREVAVLCNHQRAVPKSHGSQMEKLGDKVLAIKYERRQVKQQIHELLDSKERRKRPELLEPESDLDDEFIERHLVALEEKEKDRLAKLLVKENEKRVENGKKAFDALPADLAVKREVGAMNLERLEKRMVKLNETITNQKTALVDKDENKQTSLGTSKINYIDPRITAAWCDKYEVPLEKLFTKTLRDKFKWAMDTKKDFVF